ncbi:hypothetical protein [Leptothoe kymatousa]|uniref:Uncharacterized protein n=1 Tax=Leptothoe kymatousa TAU-MAC 1615 TaxID=2364775 RepID=A0ABS5Y6X9_9CYAN|nr:hypothetical protein [Leptothoe kymatousa]MBT9313258.1 hypothetical protein [Leptothoe kymatousa TAU-MAC 1615]
MQAQSRELDELQKEFGAPANSLYSGHTDPSQSDLDFLNRGPDAAGAVLREQGWNAHEIGIVIQDSMFSNMEESAGIAAHTAQYSASSAPQSIAAVPPAFPTQGRNGYALGHPDAGIATLPNPASKQARRGRSTLARDTLILAFMAGIALALVFTLL